MSNRDFLFKTSFMNLKHLTDKTLLSDLKMLVANERIFLTKILHHLWEVDARKLYSDLGYPTPFEYARKELGYSDAAAGRRIQAARLIKQHPQVEKKIESGEISLSNAASAQRTFSQNNISDPNKRNEILKQIENKTSKECEKTLLSFLPTIPLPRDSEKPITPTMTQLKITVSDETLALLTKARSYLNQYTLNDMALNKLARHAISDIERTKFKQRESPKEMRESTGRTPTDSQKREVFLRAQGVCEKCGGIFNLQYDHRSPFALGGETLTSNLRLLCFNCNQRSRIRARL